MGVFVIAIETRRWFSRVRRVAVAAQAPDRVLERLRARVPGRHRLIGASWCETVGPRAALALASTGDLASPDRFAVHRVLDAHARAHGFDYATGFFRPGRSSGAVAAAASAIATSLGPVPRGEGGFLRLAGPFGQGYAITLARHALKRWGAPPEYAREVHRALCLALFGAALKDATAATAAALAAGDPDFAAGEKAARAALRRARGRPLHSAATAPLGDYLTGGTKPGRRWL